MQTLATLLGFDADPDAAQLFMAALGIRRIVTAEALSVDLGRADTGRADSSDGDGEEGNEEVVDMEIDEI